jgi:hypothetical protein
MCVPTAHSCSSMKNLVIQCPCRPGANPTTYEFRTTTPALYAVGWSIFKVGQSNVNCTNALCYMLRCSYVTIEGLAPGKGKFCKTLKAANRQSLKVFFVKFFFWSTCLRAGWPDWAKFRLMGDCFLQAVFNYRNSPKFYATFSTVKYLHQFR